MLRSLGSALTGICSLVLAAVSASAEPLNASVPDGSDTVWTIESGVYAGIQVPLSINLAVGRRGKEHFWRLTSGGDVSNGIVGWKSNRYPIPVSFRHGRRSPAIGTADSIAFWQIINEMNTEFGREIFRATTVVNDDPADMIIIDLGVMPQADGLSRVTWAPSGELFDVRVTFHDAGVLHDTRVVMHEMMHALGFGHTTGWSSVLNPNGSGAARLTPEDVAYAELAMHSRIKREWADTRELIALAVSRESLRGESDTHAVCTADEEGLMRIRSLSPPAVLTVVSPPDSCTETFASIR